MLNRQFAPVPVHCSLPPDLLDRLARTGDETLRTAVFDMDHYVPGGDVHVNSGIPNHAFYVVATTLGGHAWDAAGRIWYSTLTDAGLAAGSTFQDFAKLTLIHAQRTYGATSKEALAIKAGWDAVKVPST